MAILFSPSYILTRSSLIILILILVNTNVVFSSDSSVTASNTTGIPAVAEGNFSLSELDKFGHVDGVWGKVTINHEISQYLGPLAILKGFVSSVKMIFGLYSSLMKKPTATIDDVIKKIDSEFKDVKAHLTQIATKLHKMEIYTYRDVDLVVDKSISDIMHKTTTDLANRAINLYDQLFTFMRGMLGIHIASPDLLDIIWNLQDCNSKGIMKNAERFITLVNVGVVGISYYTTVINNKAIFDGEARIQTLNALKDAVLKRTTDMMNTCASMTESIIEKYINQIMGPKQSDSTVVVSQALYERFDNIYPSHINWVFYIVWNFSPADYHWPQYPHQTDHMFYSGSGTAGVTKNGGWSVYWAGHPSGNTAGSKIFVDSSKISAVIHEMKQWANPGMYRNAHAVLHRIEHNIVTGRQFAFKLVIANPISSATLGKPLCQLDVFYHRFHSDFGYISKAWPHVPFWRTNYFDVVIF